MSDLTENQKQTLAVLETSVYDKTVEARGDHWVANVKENRPIYSQGNPTLRGLTAFIVAAGPSLSKNIDALRNIGHLGVIVAIDASYRFLAQRGITPDYCVSLDADKRMLSMVEGAPTHLTTLVAQASACPELVKAWKGPRYFLRATGGTKDLDEKLHAAHRVVKPRRDLPAGQEIDPVNDIEVLFPGLAEALICGGNVTTYAHSFALSLLKAQRIVFVGADYSWVPGSKEFYAGTAHEKMGEERKGAEQIFSHPCLRVDDKAGQPLSTNYTMFSFKKWHDDLASMHPGHAVNASEGGILGVSQAGNPLPGWTFKTLEEAVAEYTPQRVNGYPIVPGLPLSVPAADAVEAEAVPA